jgi:FKBP-type peptidyl-prolyl cis-trans isomerase FkpA
MRKLNKNEWIAVTLSLFVIGFFFLFGEQVLRVAINSGARDVKIMTIPQIISEDTQFGTGTDALPGRQVTVNYTGKFTDGKIFDTSVGKAPLTFLLGAGQVIQGWDKGVVGMKVGGKRILTVPPEYGYGANDYGPIPGGSTLVFEIELLNVQ